MLEFYEKRSTDIPEIDDRLSTVVEIVAERRPSRILDIACGRGTLLSRIGSVLPNADLSGADVSAAAVGKARELGLNVTQADVSKELPFPDESFDCAIFGEVIEHIVDPDFALQQISRILCKGGTLIVTTPNLASWCNRLLLLAGIQPLCTETSLHVNLGRRLKFLGQWRPTQGHLKIFTLAALREMLAANGFSVELVRGAPFPKSPDPKSNRIASIDSLFSRFPSLASDLIVVATNRRTLQMDYPMLPGWW
jgi:SAM-dependent methyltransferase